MSSLAPVFFPAVPAGEGKVNATALDATLASIIDKVNQIVAAVNAPRRSDGWLVDGSIGLRHISPECVAEVQRVIAALLTLRQSFVTNYDPRQTIVEAPTVAEVDGTVTFVLGQAAPVPAFSVPLTIQGIHGTPYEMILRLRSVARPAPIAPSLTGYSPGNRILSTPFAVLAQAAEVVGVTAPSGKYIINADHFVRMLVGDISGGNSNRRMFTDGIIETFAVGAVGFRQAVWSVDHWVALGNDATIHTSPDGVEWTAGATLTGGTPHRIKVSGYIVMVVMQPFVVRVSVDGGFTWLPDAYTPFGTVAGRVVADVGMTTSADMYAVGDYGGDVAGVAHALVSALPAPPTAWTRTIFTGTKRILNIYGKSPEYIHLPDPKPWYHYSVSGGSSWSQQSTNIVGLDLGNVMARSTVRNKNLFGLTDGTIWQENTLSTWTILATMPVAPSAIADANGETYVTQGTAGVSKITTTGIEVVMTGLNAVELGVRT